MNDRKRKIFIIALVVITIFVLIYIVYLFWGKKSTSTDEQGGRVFDFGELNIRRRLGIDGSKVDTKTDPIDLGNTPNTGNQNPGDPNGGQTDFNDVTLPDYSGGLTPLPDPGNLNPGGGGGFGPNPDDTIDIVDIIDPKDVTKDRCKDRNLSSKLRDILCEEPGQGVGEAQIEIIPFSLNDEEQAELDRLNRMFARLAPYLKTEADITRESSNHEAYEDFVVEANKLTRNTDIERRSSTYKGPVEITRPFLTKVEFGNEVKDELMLELVGKNDFKIKLIDLLGVPGLGGGGGSSSVTSSKRIVNAARSKLNLGGSSGSGSGSGSAVGDTIDGIADIVWERLELAISAFTKKQFDSKVCSRTEHIKQNSRDLTPSSDCGFSLFEETLKIY